MTRKKSPTGKAGRPRSTTPKGEAAKFLADLTAVALTPESFAQRAGIGRATPYRWIRTSSVPPWAMWIVELLKERREAAARFARPAE